ncbi:hypothetical protein ACQEVB_10880 [Pseudonocardia sp. CA-107938]|uniref:hypothetical protein n=1 Tax=Pseudonocardia sp. CA-107938 TaxID=3240021 RepID=UPI003D9404C3
MVRSAFVLPRHRRNPVRTRVLDVTAKVGSAVTLAALVVVAGAAAGLSVVPHEPPTKVVTFEMAR